MTKVDDLMPSLVGTSIMGVLLLIGSGVVASAQIGKAIISMPLILDDLALGLDLAGLIVAIFATLGATIRDRFHMQMR
jgi:hypothetical protein